MNPGATFALGATDPAGPVAHWAETTEWKPGASPRRGGPLHSKLGSPDEGDPILRGG